ncbi:MAG: peptidoglycan-binding protein LysM [Burkholderiaceae bacterium]
MGLFSFIQDAGEKLFGSGEAKAAQAAAATDPSADKVASANAAASKAIADYIASQNLSADGLAVAFDGAASSVTVSGQAQTQEEREKILLCCGNVAGVAKVNDEMTVAQAADESTYHTVVKGDTLSKIAKVVYGDAMKYPVIFEANKPMLSDPDKIYPGQLLRIPPISKA